MASSNATCALERGCGCTHAVTALLLLAVLVIGFPLLPGPAVAKPPVAIEDDYAEPAVDASASLGRGQTVLFYDDMEGGAPGWTALDTSLQPTRFHVDPYMAYGDAGYSWWCGTFDYDEDGGYGNHWDQRLELPPISPFIFLSLTAVIQFQYRCDSEGGYDIAYVEAMRQNGTYEILASYTGNSSGWQDSGPIALLQPLIVYYSDPLMIRFRFVSDNSYSDQDYDFWYAYNGTGFQSVGGGFMCDNIRLYDPAQPEPPIFYEDCEAGSQCVASVPPQTGQQYWHVMDRKCWSRSRPHSWWCGDDADTAHIPANIHNTLISPIMDINVEPGTPCTLKFTMARQVPFVDGNDGYAFGVSYDGGATWVTYPAPGVFFNSADYPCATHYTRKFNLASYLPTASVQLKWIMVTSDDGCGPGAYGGAGLAIDDVKIVAWPVTAPAENIVCVPDPLILGASTPTGQIAVNYTGGGGGAIYAYSIRFTWDAAVVSTTPADVVEGTLLSSAGATRFLKYQSGNQMTVDCTLLGDNPGVSTPGTMFTVDFDALGTGSSPVDITIVAVRDRYNNPLSGFLEDDGLITADITPPEVLNVSIANLTLLHTDDYAKDGDDLQLTATVTDASGLTAGDITADLWWLIGGGTAVPAENYSAPHATWTLALENADLTTPDEYKTVTVTATDDLGNVGTGVDGIIVDNTAPDPIQGFMASPGHEELVMSWGDPSGLDDHYYGVMGRYYVWGQYPEYDPPAPSYPAGPTDGALGFDQTGLVMAWNMDILPRDIYYVSAWAYDYAMNYGSVGGRGAGQDRSTNYWLGDVANTGDNWVPDGLVTVNDINKLAGQYGSAPTGDFNKCDVGPTDDHSRVGIPEPDDFLNFEDLIIFAMNYGVVAPKIVPFLSEPADEALALSLAQLTSSPDGEVQVALRLEGNMGEVKGISTAITFDPAQLEFVSARLSDAMASPIAETFFWSGTEEGKVLMDLAVLGTGVTIGGSGEIAVLTFRAPTGEYSLGFEEALLRGAENEDLTAELEGLESRPEMPTVFRLAQNVPNPFNPKTTVAYEVPQESAVSIRVYDVTGRLVTTLVDGTVEPGRYSVEWDGTAGNGESVGSGVYFCVMETPVYSSTQKMTLLK